MIIRGKRICDQLQKKANGEVEELHERSTFNQLYANAKSGFPTSTKREDATQPVIMVEVFHIPQVGMKVLQVEGRAQTQGSQRSGKNQENFPKVAFNQVEFEQESTEDNITVTAKNKEEYSFQQIDLNATTVRVSCTCEDYYWRFAAYNAKDQSSLRRAPPPYKRTSNRGPSNPAQVPGVCKHIIKLVEVLVENQAVSNASF